MKRKVGQVWQTKSDVQYTIMAIEHHDRQEKLVVAPAADMNERYTFATFMAKEDTLVSDAPA